MIAAAREIIATGVKWVVVSRAKQGALMISDNLALAAVMTSPDAKKVVSQVGCGDVLVAGLAFAQQQHYAPAEMLKLAVACSAANLFSLEPGQFESEKLAQMMENVQIRVL